MTELEKRLLDLAAQLEPVPDAREMASRPSGADLDAAVRRLEALTALLRGGESERDWDAVDQVTVRLTLDVLATIAAELRRSLVSAGTLLDSAHTAVRSASVATEKELDKLEAVEPTDTARERISR
jgi:hypothetical protein